MNIFQQLVQIILLQRRPQDLEFDQSAAVFYAVLTAGLNYITSAQAGVFSQPLIISLVQTAAQAGLLYLFLQITDRTVRFVQTCTAFFGVNAILTAITWLLVQIPALSVLAMLLMAWSFCISILIMRDAFDASFLRAVLIAVGIGALAVFVTMLVVPSYITEAQQIFLIDPAKTPGSTEAA